MNQIVYRLKVAISNIPDIQAWLYSGKLLLLYGLISFPVGFHQGFLRFELMPASGFTIISVVASCFVIPGITEELFFRVLLLPHLAEKVTTIERWLWASISLVVFVVYHPLEGLTIFPEALQTFINPVFLLLAALLGLICTLAYFQSGSLWNCVSIHWIVVVVWLVLLGGYGKLHTYHLQASTLFTGAQTILA